MIPSDHFVRFYNEVFKFMDERGDLEKYFAHVSAHQERHCLELFKTRGLQGVYDYYLKIRKEENCDLDIDLTDSEFSFYMRCCPSLSKVLDNDAAPCAKYCSHCFGWIAPLLTKAGLYIVFDVISPELPQCKFWIYDDLDRARAKARQNPELKCNFTP